MTEMADERLMPIEEQSSAWRARLLATITEAKTSQRAVSLAAKLSAGAINSWIKDGKDPSLDHLLAACGALNISVYYLLYGIRVDRETEALMQLLQGDPDTRDDVLNILRRKSASNTLQEPETPPSVQDGTQD